MAVADEGWRRSPCRARASARPWRCRSRTSARCTWSSLAAATQPFQKEELGLLRGMGRVLTLALRNLRLFENERALRSDSERQASENARLLEPLRERQVLLERFAQLQREIVDRLPVQEVLEAAVEGACELLGDDVGVIRLTDPDDPDPYHAGRLGRRRRRAVDRAPPPAGRRRARRARDA